MALLELCLLSLLSPQEPTPSATATSPAANPPSTISVAANGDTQDHDGDERAQLLAAERAGAKADPAILAQLTSSPTEKVAARAAFLLGRLKDEKAITALGEVVTGSPHASARLQAIAALLRHAHVGSVAPAIRALEDGNREVRTIAAQLLGKLRRPAATDPLLALLEREPGAATPKPAAPTKATDVQATLLALNDLGAQDHLLRAANAIQRHATAGVGEALAFYFQTQSPKLDRANEVTLLVAVLDHREALLRRYALGRLATLAEPTTASALEGRLATESPELRPLVEVALAAARPNTTPPAQEGVQRIVETAKSLAKKAKQSWDDLPEDWRIIAAATPVALLLLMFVVGRIRRRGAAKAQAAATMALVAPSEEHLQELAAEAEAIEAAADAEAMAADAQQDAAPADENELVNQ